MSVDEAVGSDLDVDEWLERMRLIVRFEPEAATIDELDAIAPCTNAVGGLVSSLRARCAARRVALADAAATAGTGSPDHGDPEGGHSRSQRRSRRLAAKDLEREQTLRALPGLRDVLLAGTIGIEHVDIVTAVLRDLTVQQRVTVRDHGTGIAALAVANGPERFRTALRQLLFRLVEEDGIRRLERQRANTRLSVSVDPDSGMVKLYGEYDPERGAILTTRLQNALDTLYALPSAPGCPDDPIAKNNHLRALALLSLIQRGGQGGAGDGPTDGGPDHANIDMVVLVDHDTLRHGVHEHSIIDAGPGIDLPVETLRRLACCANIIPAVLGSNGVILDQGREARLANRRQRRALRAMYPTCAIAGCHIKFDHCKIHHILWWDRDRGPTDLVNLLPLCSKHHHAVHEGGWQLTMHPISRELTIRFPDGTITTMPPPRRGWNGIDGATASHDQSTAAATPSGDPAAIGSATSTATATVPPGRRTPGRRSHLEPEPEPPPDITLWAS